MKRLLCSLAAIIAFVTASNAQDFHVGAKAGANMTKMDGLSFKDGYQLGYQLGGFVELDFTKTIGIQPELLFSQTNTKVASGFKAIYDSIGNTVVGEKVHLNYLSIPVLLRINAGKLLTFHVGPQFSILMNKDKTLLKNGEDAFKQGDLAMIGGAQLNLGKFRVYGRYNVGLANINDIDNRDKWKNQQVQLGVGFKIL